MDEYDSAADTAAHIAEVAKNLSIFVSELVNRAGSHDKSKFGVEEKSAFDKITPLLKNTTYGSDGYKAALKEQKPAIDHHYQNNPHHPEHYKNGICDMNLVDLLEMLADWFAATKRHANGDILKSLEINTDRFEIGAQLHWILENTIREFFLEKTND
jgi:flagellar basal body rod protein FlgC